jgi:hypothetical protein
MPDISESEAAEIYRLLSLDAWVRMKFASFRAKTVCLSATWWMWAWWMRAGWNACRLMRPSQF